MDKYKDGTYHKGYFLGGSNSDLNLIMCEDKIVIPSKLQSYVLHWYHTYTLHPGMYITEAMINHNLYCPKIRDAVHKEVTNCDTCKRKKWSNNKYGTLPDKLAEEITWNKFCVDLIGPYFIMRKGQK